MIQSNQKNNRNFDIASASKPAKDNKFYDEIISLHIEACEKKEDFYLDPQMGFTVFTAYYHLKRGYCCGSGCRH